MWNFETHFFAESKLGLDVCSLVFQGFRLIQAAKRVDSANCLVFSGGLLVFSFTAFCSSDPKIQTLHTGFL